MAPSMPMSRCGCSISPRRGATLPIRAAMPGATKPERGGPMQRVWGAIRFVRRLACRVQDSRLGLIAAGVAFYAIFAIFPGLTATIAIWSLIADPAVIGAYLDVADEFIPPEAWAILNSQITALLAAPRMSLGWASSLSILLALGSARAGVAALIQGLDMIHGTRPRSGVAGFVLGILLTLALVAAVLAGLATVVLVPLGLALVPLGPLTGWVLTALPWAAMLLLLLTSLGILYRYGPNTGRRQPWASPGAIVATMLWAAVSLGFSAYLANLGSYNRVYGSLGAVIALLMWLYLSSWAVLLGAVLDAERSAQDQ
ncbi:hypothetical protein CCR83_12840 [Rhodobacter veldkampii DSM 11550]|uniref:YihY/virulence factor BrkB family protein n=2 Tax=Phaeovulum veldkampii TaxID=33049 RepID=A0A2T4JJ84_9RHOB|nr:hypothetical protein [Phaeovulum veldkampii DSM 11550]PTE17954.1 hypothetical protein C5F46_06985 [Phaeovulum veldkampii DSM 11550]